MTIRQRAVVFLTVGAVAAAGVSGGVFAATGSATVRTRDSATRVATTASTFAHCGTGYWCDYIYDNGYDICFKVSPFAGPGNVPNWGHYGCRNVDGAIYNDSPFTLRVFFGPNYHDPHACINPFTKIRDLFRYDFNSGRGPHKLVIGNDIASSTISLNRCTNPL
jgi:hypothetical protein